LYGPSGGAGGFAAYDPRTGTYARGGAVCGPYVRQCGRNYPDMIVTSHWHGWFKGEV